MTRVFLDFAPSETAWVDLRELRGEDEETVAGTDTAEAISLLDRLLSGISGARFLTASDRDRLLAEIYRAEYGARIDCVLRCESCEQPFDIDFTLPDLMASLGLSGPRQSRRRDDILLLPGGRRLRLPRGDDELALLGLDPDTAEAALLARCLLDGEATPDDEGLLEALEQAAPILDVDLDAVCPECGTQASAHFDMQHYLLSAIMREAPIRTAEIHLLASAYHWSPRDILSLPRGRRRAFAMAIERDRGALAGGF